MLFIAWIVQNRPPTQPHFDTYSEGIESRSTTAPGGRIPNPPLIFTMGIPHWDEQWNRDDTTIYYAQL